MKNKIIIVTIAILTMLIILIGCSTSDYPSSANDDEIKLINYIVEHGSCNSNKSVYTISESTYEAGFEFFYSIQYNKKTKQLIFKEIADTFEGTTTTYMYFECGENRQNIEVEVTLPSGKSISATGYIQPSKYSATRQTIYGYKSNFEHSSLKNICEDSLYSMLLHCQLLMIDADTGMVPFGFKNGLF